jgi:hypothetical protein
MGPSDGRPRSEDDIGRRTNKASAQGAREVPFSLKWKNQSRGREEERSPSDRGSEGGERRNIREGGERNREEWAVNAKPRTSFSLSILLPRTSRPGSGGTRPAPSSPARFSVRSLSHFYSSWRGGVLASVRGGRLRPAFFTLFLRFLP